MNSGYRIHRNVFDQKEIATLRTEADRLAEAVGTPCVRGIAERSLLFREVAEDSRMAAMLPRGLRWVRSLLFDKTPEMNWPVAWHQDMTIAVARRVEVEGYGPWSKKESVPHFSVFSQYADAYKRDESRMKKLQDIAKEVEAIFGGLKQLDYDKEYIESQLKR